jgi:hypothetical protein
MSIDAITSSYCCKNQLDSIPTVISRQNLIDAALYKQEEYQPLPPMSELSPPSWCEPNEWYRSKEAAVGHWIKSSNQELGFIAPSHQSSERVPLMSTGTIVISSPSYSTSSSEHEFDYRYSSSSPRYHHSRHRTNSTLISKDTIDSLNSEKKSISSSFDYNNHESHCRSSNDRKSNAIANRRARNKLASAKYRAKKQALTHAMQDRILQLATQVMNLRNELNQTKNSETELLGKYERLVKYFQSDKSMQSSVSLKENAVANPQYNSI